MPTGRILRLYPKATITVRLKLTCFSFSPELAELTARPRLCFRFHSGWWYLPLSSPLRYHLSLLPHLARGRTSLLHHRSVPTPFVRPQSLGRLPSRCFQTSRSSRSVCHRNQVEGGPGTLPFATSRRRSRRVRKRLVEGVGLLPSQISPSNESHGQ